MHLFFHSFNKNVLCANLRQVLLVLGPCCPTGSRKVEAVAWCPGAGSGQSGEGRRYLADGIGSSGSARASG